MAITNFQTTIWSGAILRVLRKRYVYSALAAQGPYGGHITGGNVVKILGIGDVAIKTYTKDTNMAAPDALTDSGSTLTIDQQKYFNFAVDDIDQAQSINGGQLVDAAAVTAANGLVDVADQYMAGLAVAGVDSSAQVGTTGTPIAIAAAADAYAHLLALRSKAARLNIPTAGRFVVVPPEFTAYLLQDGRFVAGYSMAQDARLSNGLLPSDNGFVGSIAGWNVYESNNTPLATTKYSIIGGTQDAWAFASNIDETIAYKPELRFGDAVKGLSVYGGKVVRPKGMVLGTVTIA